MAADYHGEGYLYARNDVLNANDWQSNHRGNPRGAAHYYYPGGNFGGPVPFTHKKLRFWVGYERILQNTGNANRLQSFIPTADMMAGNFTNTAANVTFCQGKQLTPGCDQWMQRSDRNGIARWHDHRSGNTACRHYSREFLDPGAKALASFWPAANANPLSSGSGFNYDQPIPGTHNGYLFRARVDYNLSDKTSFFISYQYGQDCCSLAGQWRAYLLDARELDSVSRRRSDQQFILEVDCRSLYSYLQPDAHQ